LRLCGNQPKQYCFPPNKQKLAQLCKLLNQCYSRCWYKCVTINKNWRVAETNGNEYWKPRHLYIVDDDTKEGKYGYHKSSQEICIVPKGGFPTGHCLKIIATTDNLQIADLDTQYLDYNPSKFLPQIPQQFIQLSVDAINKTYLVANGGLISIGIR